MVILVWSWEEVRVASTEPAPILVIGLNSALDGACVIACLLGGVFWGSGAEASETETPAAGQLLTREEEVLGGLSLMLGF